MDHIDIYHDDSCYMGLRLKNCSAWGCIDTDTQNIEAKCGEGCYIKRRTDEIISYGEGSKDILMTHSFYSLQDTKIYLGAMAEEQLNEKLIDYGAVMNSLCFYDQNI